MSETVTSNLLEEAQANTLAAVQRQVAALNEAGKSDYLNVTFANFVQNVTAGRIDNANPPQPPPGWAVGYFTDPTTGPGSHGPYGDTPIQWAYPKRDGGPVCEMPPVPGLPGYIPGSKGEARIGSRFHQDGDVMYFNILPPGKDTMPVDAKTGLGLAFPGKSADEITGWFQKHQGPFGAFYQRLGPL